MKRTVGLTLAHTARLSREIQRLLVDLSVEEWRRLGSAHASMALRSACSLIIPVVATSALGRVVASGAVAAGVNGLLVVRAAGANLNFFAGNLSFFPKNLNFAFPGVVAASSGFLIAGAHFVFVQLT